MSKRYTQCWKCNEPIIFNDKYSELVLEGKDTKGVPRFLNYPDESPHICGKKLVNNKDSINSPKNKLYWARIDVEKALNNYLSINNIPEKILNGEIITLSNIEDYFIINKYKDEKFKEESTEFILTLRNLIIENLNTRIVYRNNEHYIYLLKENDRIGIEKWENPKGIGITCSGRKGLLPGIFNADWFNDPQKVEKFYKDWEIPTKKSIY